VNRNLLFKIFSFKKKFYFGQEKSARIKKDAEVRVRPVPKNLGAGQAGLW